jgi:hypothetical protein
VTLVPHSNHDDLGKWEVPVRLTGNGIKKLCVINTGSWRASICASMFPIPELSRRGFTFRVTSAGQAAILFRPASDQFAYCSPHRGAGQRVSH